MEGKGADLGLIGAGAPSADSIGLACAAGAEVHEVQRALAGLQRWVSAGPHSGHEVSRAEWAGLVAGCQALVNTATAVQNVAITRLAAVEEEWLEDGTTVESRRALGHIALDAPDIVAGALGASHVHAQRRVSLAVRLVAGGDHDGQDQPVGAPPGLSGLHDAMIDGRLDGYRAGVVAEELAEAPAEVAEAVVGALDAYLGIDTAVQLKRRCRRAIARISPDLLRQRAKRAREECGLRRWVEEPGIDRWEGTFPSEHAAEGWAAVDALAQRYVAEGRCSRVEGARSVALMDLVRGQATIDVRMVVAVPATQSDHDREGHGTGGAGRCEIDPSLHWVVGVPPDAGVRTPAADPAPPVGSSPRADCSPRGESDADSSPGAEPSPWVRPLADPSPWGGLSPGGDRPQWRDSGADSSPRFGSSPGADCSPGGDAAPAPRALLTPDAVPFVREYIAAATDNIHLLGLGLPIVRTRDARSHVARRPSGGVPTLLREPTVSEDDFIEVLGPLAGEPLLVRRGWATALENANRARVQRVPCHVLSGALVDDEGSARAAYRPGDRLTMLVRLRDGRCRFPGCSVASRFCDLDHVRPWPTGPTAAANLMCLCRRHHRVKQRPGWSVSLESDARAVWTDPTGRVRSTAPRDLLDVVVLPVTPGERVRPAPLHPSALPGSRTPLRAPASPAPVTRFNGPVPGEGEGERGGPPSSAADAVPLGGALDALLAVLADHAAPGPGATFHRPGYGTPCRHGRAGVDATVVRVAWVAGRELRYRPEHGHRSRLPRRPAPAPCDPPPF